MSAIVQAELKLRYSTKAGSAGNVLPGTPNGSLGGWISQTEWPDGGANTLFDDVSGAENASQVAEYRCVFVWNTNSANALENAVAWLSAEIPGGAQIALAVDPTAASPVGSTTPQALVATTESAPGAAVANLTFTSPTSIATGLPLGTIPPGQVKPFWVRRAAVNSTALSNDGVTVSVTGDTGSL